MPTDGPHSLPQDQLGLASQVLNQLQSQLRTLHTELFELHGRLARLQPGAQADLVVLLLAANEQLVLSALEAQGMAEAALQRLDELALSSQHDALTHTPNRVLLLDRLESAVTLAQRRGTRVAVLFLDIDHFKQINDTLGHTTGDGVLQLVAQRLQDAVRDSDAVGRLGGDEFLVLLGEVSRVADAAAIAQKIIADLALPAAVCGHSLRISVSLGIAIYPDDAEDAHGLISLADAAMYRSKRSGGSSYSLYQERLAPDGSTDPP